MVDSKTRARRLLAILHLLEPDTELGIDTIAESLGARPEEVAADLELLAMCGISQEAGDQVPIYLEDGVVVVYNPLPALDRAIRLSGAEAQALVAALQTAGIDPGNELIAKLLAATAARDVSAEQISHIVRASVGPETGTTLGVLALALEQHRVVALSYQSSGTSDVTARDCEPMELVNDKGVWYLEAFCRRAGALRTFRVDRIREARIEDEVFAPRALDLTGAAIVTDGLPVATVRLAPGEEFSARDWPGAHMTAVDDDGSVVVAVPYAGTGWIARQVLARLGGAQVLEPAEVRNAVADLARCEIEALG